uniref:Ig-like domain-containing protein n=1 Tax=Sinocyclocheilus grahami TaxID=75366 RepID=A0A672K0E0_SINGR
MPQIVFTVQLSLISVCLQVTGVFGGSVVLPCSTQHDLELQDIVVFWRHNNSKIVHDIIKGNQKETQDSLYKNRTESFPDEYPRGNFSVKLSNLTHAHAGKYSCHITPSELQNLKLLDSCMKFLIKKARKSNNGDFFLLLQILQCITICILLQNEVLEH